VLHTFHGKDGYSPRGQLVIDESGNLYGTTNSGGKANANCLNGLHNCGTVFKMTKSGTLVWLHTFDRTNGMWPDAGLLRDTAGNLYGTTQAGGRATQSYPYGCGVVFKLDRTGKGTALYKFKGIKTGCTLEALLVGDSAGNLYGTTLWGGIRNQGVIFKVDKAGKGTVLHTFTGGADGASDYFGFIWGAGSSLYSVAGGGADGQGMMFKMDTSGNKTVLYNFQGGSYGSGQSLLVADAAGNFYGTTQQGGNMACNGGYGCGVVYELSPQSNGTWAETVLYTFCSLTNCTDGNRPEAGPLVRDAPGNLYGMTAFGGASSNCDGCGDGVVFKLDTAGKETVLHSFTDGSDGGGVWGGLTMDAAGNLYGAVEWGGDLNCPLNKGYGCGVVFKITP